MTPARIAELLEPFLGPPDDRRLTTADLDQISTHIDLLLRWNARINLTAIRDPEQIVPRHFGESLFLARHLFPNREQHYSTSHPERSGSAGKAGAPAQSKDPYRFPTSAELLAPGSTQPMLKPSPPATHTTAPAAKRRHIAAQGASPGSGQAPDQAPEGRKMTLSGEPAPKSAPTAAPPHADPASRVPDDAIMDDRSQLEARTSPLVLDLGSGAGFPALPLKIWAPEIRLTLIESNHKKAAFLREVIRSLTLTNVNVIAARAETILPRLAPPPAESGEHSTPNPEQSASHPEPGGGFSPARAIEELAPFDVVTFRAVEHFDRILTLAAAFLAPQGRLALLIGSSQLPQLRALPKLTWTSIHIPQSQNRIAAIGHRQL